MKLLFSVFIISIIVLVLLPTHYAEEPSFEGVDKSEIVSRWR
jgi:hypothetical protein